MLPPPARAIPPPRPARPVRPVSVPPAELGLLGRLLALRREELRPAAWAAAFHFFLFAAYYILRPLRDEIGAEHRELVATAWSLVAVACLALVPLYSWAGSRWPRRRFLPRVFRAFGLVVLAFYLLLRRRPADGPGAPVEMAFYVWVSVFVMFAATVFWGLMADLFRPDQGRRMFGLLALGGSLGGITGPLLVGLLVEPIGADNLLLLAVLLLEAALFCQRRTERAAAALGPVPPATAAPLPGGALDGIPAVFASPYLRRFAGYLLVFVFGSGFLYFFQLDLARGAFPDRVERREFFALVDLAVNTSTLLVQFLVTGRLLGRIGVGWTLTLVPLLTAAGFLGLAAWPDLGLFVALYALRRTANFALSRPARETLFTVVPRAHKYKAKAFLDTFVYRGGDVATGWIYHGLAALGLGAGGLCLVAAPVAAAGVVLARSLGRRLRAAENGPAGGA
ncbi:MAG: MFS transporter [Planctomycetota bacterium]|nr:MAG: MFS transporter [Planctomycetota bacterium]